MKRLNLLLAMMMATVLAFATVKPDNEAKIPVQVKKSEVKWVGEKVTGSHHGTIDLQKGHLEVSDGRLKGGSFVIDMNTIQNLDLEDPTYNQKLVGHLKSEDFFGVEKHPEAKFNITNTEYLGNNRYNITGNLTIKGITHPISFPAKVQVTDDGVKANAKLTFDRSKWDIRYGSDSFFDGLGDKMIYDEVKIELSLVAAR